METRRLEATVQNLDKVLEFADGLLETVACPIKIQMQIDLAIEEIFVNIANYAYAPETGMAEISVEITASPKTAVITFSDSGKPYNPLEKADPDINLSAKERQIGGLGIYMVKKTMDDVQYEYAEGKNRLTLVKKLNICE